ncbi:MAG: flagellar protein FlaG [Firmicutes bacterium]|nr:flagellar protein FlaG [Bacillota bacterium]
MDANLQTLGNTANNVNIANTTNNVVEPRRPQNQNTTQRPVEQVPAQDQQQPTVTMATPPAEVQATIALPNGEQYTSNEVTNESITRALDTVNEALAPSHFSLNSSVHEATNTIMVSVVDTNTNEVIRELPPESRLDLLARIKEFAGLLVDVTS